MRVLLVEEGQRTIQSLRQALTEAGHDVIVAFDGRHALRIATTWTFDFIIMDLTLPDIDGLTVARRLRTDRNYTPILMLIARESTKELVKSLAAGADDYLTKPVRIDTLLERMRTLARQTRMSQSTVVQVDDLMLNLATRQAKRATRSITLTATEFSIVELLMCKTPEVVSRQTIIERVWGPEADVSSNTLDAFIRLIRTKIEASGEPKLLHTVRGVGYTIRREETESEPEAKN